MKTKKILLLAIVLLLSCLSLFADAKIIPLSSSLYSDMDLLYQMVGLSAPSNARPWSGNEAKLIINKVNKQNLSSNLIPLYERIDSIINDSLDIKYDSLSSGDFTPIISLEGYYHTNTTDYLREDDWAYSFEERRPFLKLEVEYAMSDWIYLYCDFQYSKGRTHNTDAIKRFSELFPKVGKAGGMASLIPPFDPNATHNDYNGRMGFDSIHYSKGFNNNFTFKSYDLDNEWPKRALVSLSGAHWTAYLGRDKVKWGNGKIGNFVLDDHTEFNDFFRASVFSENYKFDYVILAFDTNFTTGNGSPDTEFKLFFAHRFEFRIFDKVTLAFSENVAYQNDVFNFKYLNPAFFFHNDQIREMFNAIAHLELDVTLPLGFRAYFQFGMDQAKAPNENDSQADATGFLLGVNWANIFENSHSLNINAEFAKTSPLLYRRDLVDFIHLRKIHTYGTGGYVGFLTVPEYIAFKYGGDALVFQLDAEYDIPSFGSISAQFFYMKHGKMNFFVSHNKDGNNSDRANYEGSTPSGNDDEIETTFIYTIGFDFDVPLKLSFMDISIYSDLSYISQYNKLVYNPNGTNETILMNLSGWTNDFQLSFGASLRF